MSKIKEQILLILILFISTTLAQNEEGDRCRILKTGAEGVCTKLPNCKQAITEIRRRGNPQVCSFDGTSVIVCCTQSMPSSEKGCPPLPIAAVSVTKTGQVAWDYCIDLAKTIFNCKQSLLLGGPRERQNLCSHLLQPLIVSSTPAGKGEFPHMALLGYGDILERATYHCSGTLINERWVLTAADCLNRGIYGNVKFVRLGSPNLNDTIEKRKLYYIETVVKHPNYKTSSPQMHNIALLKLNRNVLFGQFVIPACLHTGLANTNIALVSGWSDTKTNVKRMGNNLKKATLEEFSNDECSTTHPEFSSPLSQAMIQTQMCYGSRKNAKDSCQGDIGSPLQISNENVYCTYTVIGVEANSNYCGDEMSPVIYTKVSAYITWIESVAWA